LKRVTLRQQLLLVVAAAVLPLAVMSTVALYVGYGQQREQAQRSGLDIARASSKAIDSELRRTISVLDVLGDFIVDGPEGLRAFDERARRVREAQPSWETIHLADMQGHMLTSTETPFGQPLRPIFEQESFDKVLQTQAPIVGYLRKGPRGKYGFPVRVPVMRDGRLRFVLTAVLAPDAILALLGSQRVSGDWVVAVADGKGLRVARTQSSQESIGTPYSPTLVAMMERGGAEGTGITQNSEGEDVFTAFTRARETGWVTAVGLPTSAVDAGARRSFFTLGGGIVLSIVAGFFAALFMARRFSEPMLRLRDAAHAMGRGEPIEPIESAIHEIHDVSRTLATAAQEQAAVRTEREDLLQREQAARALAEDANRAKDEFLAMLGHELRNPLGAISNAAAVLGTESLAPEAAVRARAVIARQVSHLTRLMDDLLDAGRALAGKIVLRPQPLDLAVVAAQSLATLRAAQRFGKHNVTQDLQPVWVMADPIRLEQVIGNLVVNAVKYTPDGGTIGVGVWREGKDAMLRVADNGIGLSPELAARVFELFVQGDRDLDRSQGGLGIGLTLVKKLAELHGGTASVTSEGRGKGCEFTVQLPALEPPAGAILPAALPQVAGARRIVIIEDNADARETLRLILELGGHRVHTANDGATGLEMALAEKPQILFIDLGLPKIDGFEVARRIREGAGKWRPYLVALTGYGSPEDRRKSLDAGFDEHVVKPVQAEALAAVLATAEFEA
jgi:signal transduction histidine kinase/ActR/RegA family two-component response regulator